MWAVIGNFLSGGFLGKVVDSVTGFFSSRAAAREAAAAVHAKIQLAKVNKDAKLELADQDLAVLRTQQAGDSWKDEYVVILVSMPIVIGAAGAIVSIFDPATGAKIQGAAGKIAGLMTGESIDFPELWLMVVGVSLGLRNLLKR